MSKPYEKGDPGYFYPGLPLPVKAVHQFSSGTRLDNLAVRRNGNTLTTALSSQEHFKVDNRGKGHPQQQYLKSSQTTSPSTISMSSSRIGAVAGRMGCVMSTAAVTLAGGASNGTVSKGSAGGLFGPTPVRYGKIKPFYQCGGMDRTSGYGSKKRFSFLRVLFLLV